MGYKSDAQRKAVHASKADGGKGNPNKKSPAKRKEPRGTKEEMAERRINKRNARVKKRIDKDLEKRRRKSERVRNKKESGKITTELAAEKIGNIYKYNEKKDDKKRFTYTPTPVKFKYSGDSPAMRKLSASCKAAARRKFDVYPSAYANMWASKQQGKGKC